MSSPASLIDLAARALHRYLIVWLLIAYALAAWAPELGLRISHTSFGTIPVFQERTEASPLTLMLAVLLFNAGLGVQPGQLTQLANRPSILLAGVLVNLAIHIAYIVATAQILRLWYEPAEAEHILLGMALAASMPIAGSSTAWAQNANGNLALSLGLVLSSTVLSPYATPAALGLLGWAASGEYASTLGELAAGQVKAFLQLWVVLPSILGLLVRLLIAPRAAQAMRAWLKLVNSIVLLLLNYANATVALPEIFVAPDLAFLLLTLGLAVGMCVSAFTAGYWLGYWIDADVAQLASLMYGMGMSNNGTGLVLATLVLGEQPHALLPIIVYTLVQHLVAGAIHLFMFKRDG